MQVEPSGGQIFNYCKWGHLVDKFATNASGAILLLDLIQVTESISGSVVPLAMFLINGNGKPMTAKKKKNSSFRKHKNATFSKKDEVNATDTVALTPSS